MSIRSFFGGLFIMAGCSAAFVSMAGMMTSMQMQTGEGLLVGLAMLAAGALLLVFGFGVLLFRR